jgi:hypothetical protein
MPLTQEAIKWKILLRDILSLHSQPSGKNGPDWFRKWSRDPTTAKRAIAGANGSLGARR